MIRPLIGLLCLAFSFPTAAAQSDLDALLQRLKQERRAEQQHHKEREQRFLTQREQRRELLEQAREAKQQAEAEAERLRAEHRANEQRLRTLEEELATAGGELNNLFDHARQHAADTRARQANSLLAAQYPDTTRALDSLADDDRLPDIGQLEQLWLTLLDEMNRSGRLTRFQAPVITPDGTEAERGVTRIGAFSAIAEGRYLRYLPEAKRLVEPARQPPLRHLLTAEVFENNETGFASLAVDPSRGELLGLMGRSPTLTERLQQGGVIGYIILGLGAFALLLVLERFALLSWIRLQMGRQKRREQALANNPLGRLSRLADERADASLEALDMALDEAAVRESSRLTRGLTTLGVIAAMAPLLGLLGTVTGMIETFQTITLFGSGDPQLMSSGISQALVTTQLGLVVAVPVLLLHSLLKGRANRLIEQLDGHVALLLGSRA